MFRSTFVPAGISAFLLLTCQLLQQSVWQDANESRATKSALTDGSKSNTGSLGVGAQTWISEPAQWARLTIDEDTPRSSKDQSERTTKSEHAQSTVPVEQAETAVTAAADLDALPELSPEMQARQKRIARCLSVYFPKHVDSQTLAPWSIMHGLIAYGQDSIVISGGRKVGAAEYLCANGNGREKRIMYLQDGQLRTHVGPGYQGHEGQLLAMLAQAAMPADFPLLVQGKKFRIQDLIEFEMRGCRAGTELTFKLIALAHYLDSEATWHNDLGEEWSIPRLIREEIAQPINGAACGGTHRLMGLSFALHYRRQSGEPVDGEWLRAAEVIQGYQDYARKLQNSDGSYSTNWFENAEAKRSAKQRLYSTGHILEWLVYSLPNDRLDDPDITRAVDYLVALMLSAPNYELPVGPRGHATHALRIYEHRVFGGNSNVRERVVLNRNEIHLIPRNSVELDFDDDNGRKGLRVFPSAFGNRGRRRGSHRNK